MSSTWRRARSTLPSSGSPSAAGWRPSGARPTANQRAKFYRLTPEGKKQLLREQTRWGELVAAIGRILNPATAPSGSKE